MRYLLPIVGAIIAALILTTPDVHTTCQIQETLSYDVCTLELTK